jgi:hypothetical protein
MGGGWILSKQFLNGSDYIHCLAAPADTDGQADAAVFIDAIQKSQPAAIYGLVKLKVNRPT